MHSYLSRHGVPILSDKTFRKYANNMTIEVFDAMKKELENTYVFISLDSTAGKSRLISVSVVVQNFDMFPVCFGVFRLHHRHSFFFKLFG